jgi:ribosomal protein S18 acetylase RimI-like enzyme
MSDNLIYRPGTSNDVRQLKELSLASYGKYANVLTPHNWFKLNTNLNNEETFIDLINKSHSFVCVDEDRIVGMAFLLPSGNPTDIFEKEWSYIRMVGVHPDYAGQGIARRLTEKCIEKAKEIKEKTIALHTSEFMDAARHLYESMGFKVLKEIPNRLGKRYWLYRLYLD